MEAVNYIADENLFGLEAPPAWFLKRLYDYDHMLVIIPSKKDRKFLLARRRQYSVGMSDIALGENKHPDTIMLYRHGLLPLAPLNFRDGQVRWTEAGCTSLIEELKKRDTWAITGGPAHLQRDPERAQQALIDHVEGFERRNAARERHTFRDNMYHRARDAWRSMQARAGTRNKRASDHHGVAPTTNN